MILSFLMITALMVIPGATANMLSRKFGVVLLASLVIGTVGTTFGDAQVNIADMVISREKHADGSATALMVLKTDSEPPSALLNRLRARPSILKVKSLVLPPRSA